MDRHYSTLELFKHDETAGAPERDYDATAFELDTSALAPQVIPDTTPQVLYDSSFPEAHGKTEASTEERASTHHITKAALKWRWMVVALLVAAAIAIGVGVGTWRHREHSSKKLSTQISPRHILNDTSLAAVILPNGDRQLCFQENTGSIRRAVRTASDNRWGISMLFNASTHLSNGEIPNPKKYTPLAITVSGTYTTLYYVSKNNRLISISPETIYEPPDPDLANYSTAVDTRSLSVFSLLTANLWNPMKSTMTSAILYYENPTGQVSALMQSYTSDDRSDGLGSKWIDITSQISQSLPGDLRNNPGPYLSNTLYESAPSYKFSPPFTSRTVYHNGTAYHNGTLPDVDTVALFYSPLHDCILETLYSTGTENSRSPTADNFNTLLLNVTNPNQNNVGIHRSDIAIYGVSSSYIWINGTQPVSGPFDSPPENSFPFARLTSADSADRSSTFLYHQMNGTTFAEEQWDVASKAWLTPDYITIPDS